MTKTNGRNKVAKKKERYYTPGQAAKKMGVLRGTIHYHIRKRWKGKVKRQDLGWTTVYLIPESLLNEYEPQHEAKK